MYFPLVIDWAPRLFRFENCWLMSKSFFRQSEWLVVSIWCSRLRCLVNFKLFKKLQLLKLKIKEWNSVKFCSIDVLRWKLSQELDRWDYLKGREKTGRRKQWGGRQLKTSGVELYGRSCLEDKSLVCPRLRRIKTRRSLIEWPLHERELIMCGNWGEAIVLL